MKKTQDYIDTSVISLLENTTVMIKSDQYFMFFCHCDLTRKTIVQSTVNCLKNRRFSILIILIVIFL